MRRIITGLLTVIATGGVLAVGMTGAFFSDTETSTNNAFTAGAVDLKIDNDSWYNSNRCTNVGTTEAPDWQWVGEASYPVPGSSCDTSFPLADLDDGFLFFNFTDLKPDDEGEDTISIHVQNDAWMCMDLALTSNDDRSSSEPELEVDEPEDANDAWDGELADSLEFFWWADDGDNVYEEGEAAISDGVQSLLDLAPEGNSFRVALADATHNVWGEEGAPVPANETVYIAKAWCLGDLTLDPVAGNGGLNPGVNPGIDCDGTLLNNETQTDGVELNVMFTAIQARHNADFLCDPPVEPETATLTVNKIITADTEGIGVEDFELHIDLDGDGGDQIVGDNVPTTGLTPGNYNVYEVILEAGLPPGVTFTSTIGGACDDLGNVTLNPGENLVCTITNVENAPLPPPLEDNFGTGGVCVQNIPGWDEDPGDTCEHGTVSKNPGAGDDSVSPDGGNFALIGNNGYICRAVNATGLENLQLKYYWRGDTDAEVTDSGKIQYYTGGTCSAPTGLVELASHFLDNPDNNATEPWSALQTINLPGSLNNVSFFIRIADNSGQGNESMRFDGVSVTGDPI